MVAVLLRVAVPLAPFALYYLFLYKRWFDFKYWVHQMIDIVNFFIVLFLLYVNEE